MLEEPGGASYKEKEYIPPGKQHMQDITGIPTCFSWAQHKREVAMAALR